ALDTILIRIEVGLAMVRCPYVAPVAVSSVLGASARYSRLLDRCLHGMGIKRPVVKELACDLDIALRRGVTGWTDLAQVGHFLTGRIAQRMPAHEGALTGVERMRAELADIGDLGGANVGQHAEFVPSVARWRL